MAGDYLIRSAQSADRESLIDFTVREAVETEGETPEPSALRRGVEAGLSGPAPVTYWVAEAADHEVVGSISVVREWSNFRGGYYWWVQSLYLLPEHRGAGLVDRLLDTVATAARAEDALELRLYVLQSNERAQAAYRRCGFEALPYAIMRRGLESRRP